MRFSLLPWLQLCRAANVFTAMADIFAGYLLVRPNFPGLPEDQALPFDAWDIGSFPIRLSFERDFFFLLGGSSCLYLAGMVFNDVFDRDVDAVERPKRPIPSGQVSVRSAAILGGVLVVAGIVLAALAGGPSLLIAALLTGAIFAYDGRVKSTPLGPVNMGLCRGLNILLGASTGAVGANPFLAVFGLPQIHVALAMTVYVAGLTWFARNEATKSNRTMLAAAAVVVNLGIALLMAFAFNAPDPHQRSLYAAVLMGVIAVTIDRRIASALIDPSPATVQAAIRTMILSLVMLDCAVVYFSQRDPLLAALVAALLIPTLLLGRFLAVT